VQAQRRRRLSLTGEPGPGCQLAPPACASLCQPVPAWTSLGPACASLGQPGPAWSGLPACSGEGLAQLVPLWQRGKGPLTHFGAALAPGGRRKAPRMESGPASEVDPPLLALPESLLSSSRSRGLPAAPSPPPRCPGRVSSLSCATPGVSPLQVPLEAEAGAQGLRRGALSLESGEPRMVSAPAHPLEPPGPHTGCGALRLQCAPLSHALEAAGPAATAPPASRAHTLCACDTVVWGPEAPQSVPVSRDSAVWRVSVILRDTWDDRAGPAVRDGYLPLARHPPVGALPIASRLPLYLSLRPLSPPSVPAAGTKQRPPTLAVTSVSTTASQPFILGLLGPKHI